MLVDDEKLELEMLRDFVNWKQYNIEVVGTAKNGNEALALSEKCTPDLVITDVKMPIMDGLEFSKQLKRRNEKVEIIFLSGYDEFSFVKAAIKLEVADYLLKPLDFEELPPVLMKVIERVEKRKNEEKSKMAFIEKHLKDLLLNPSSTKNEELINDLGFPIGGQYSLAIISVDNFFLMDNGLEMDKAFYQYLYEYVSTRTQSAMIVQTKEGEYSIILNHERDKDVDINQLFRTLINEFFQQFQVSISIALSNGSTALPILGSMYEKTKKTLELRFYNGPGSLLQQDKINKRNQDIQIPPVHQEIVHSILNGDWKKTEELIDSLFKYFIDNEIHRDLICHELYKFILYLLNNAFTESNTHQFEQTLNNSIKNIYLFDTVEELKHFISRTIESIFQYLREKESDNHQQVVNQIILFIKENLDKPLLVEDIASKVFLSPNYIRSIFKEKTGETILSFITKAKLEKATELLHQRSLKIKDVCSSVGFESVSYFCSLYKKYKGMTPNEYRKKIF